MRKSNEKQAIALKHCISLVTLLLCDFVTILPAKANSNAQYWENRETPPSSLVFEPRLSFSSSPKNDFDHQFIDLNFSGGISKRASLFARLSLLNVDSQSTPSAFGFSNQLIGGNFDLYSDNQGRAIYLQSEISIPFYSGNTLGEGSLEWTTGVFAKIPILNSNHWALEPGLGYQYAFSVLTSSLPYSLLISYHANGRGLIFNLGLRGDLAITSDSVDLTSPVAQAKVGWTFNPRTSVSVSAADPLGANVNPSGFVLALGLKLELSSDSPGLVPTPSSAPSFKGIQTSITAINDQLYLAKINEGSEHEIKEGQIFDIFSDQTRIARAKVIAVKPSEAALNVVEYFVDQWIEVGFTAKEIP